VSWPWLVLLGLAAVLAVAVEKPRLEGRFGSAARKNRDRQKRKKQLRVVTPDDESEEFIRSVQRDLDALPTIEERDRKT
jgi:hypothetical protein